VEREFGAGWYLRGAMPERRAIAVAQSVPRPGAVEENVEEHRELARRALDQGARVVVFPELSLTGYELDRADELAFTSADPRLRPLDELARAHDVTLVVGAPVRSGARLCIGAFVLTPAGIELHTKSRLGAFAPGAHPNDPVPPPEARHFGPGDRQPLVDVAPDRVAFAICAEVGDPAHPERAADRGASAYLVGAFLPPEDVEPESRRLAGYAERHRLVVAMANFAGPTGGLTGGGRSAIWSARGELLVRLPHTGRAVATATETAVGWRVAQDPPAS